MVMNRLIKSNQPSISGSRTKNTKDKSRRRRTGTEINTIQLVTRFIARIGFDKLFTTRQLLLYGTRAAIDQALSRLVKAMHIARVARGVFIRENFQKKS